MILLLGYGFLGKSLANYFNQHAILYKVADRNVSYLAEANHIYFDLNNPTTYTDALVDADTIIHLIHPTVPSDSSYNAAIDLEYNLAANRKFLESVSKSEVKRIIYISTGGAVYGHPEYLPVDEEHPCKPISNYGKGKLLLEQLYIERCTHYSIDLKIIRPSNIYGKFQKTDRMQGVIAHIATAMLNDKPFNLWGDGNTRKDYLYVNDFNNAIRAVLDNFNTESVIYNLSSGDTHTLLDIINEIEKLLNKKLTIIYKPEQDFDVKNISLSNKKFMHDFNWKTAYSLKEGLADFINSIIAK